MRVIKDRHTLLVLLQKVTHAVEVNEPDYNTQEMLRQLLRMIAGELFTRRTGLRNRQVDVTVTIMGNVV